MLQTVTAYKRLHDMAVGAGIVVDAAEASQARAVERDGLFAAVAVIVGARPVRRSWRMEVWGGAAICRHGDVGVL